MTSETTLSAAAEGTIYPPSRPRPHPSRHTTQIYSETQRSSFVLTLALLVLLGSRPRRLQEQLDSDDPKTWDDFREGLLKRWGTLGITSGLVLASATTMLFSDRVEGAALVAAFAALCATIISITFGTALAFIFTDASAKSFRALARRPVHMIFLLSIPNMFAMGSMVALYISITIFAWSFSDGLVPTLLAKIGTTAGALLMGMLFAYATWLVRDLSLSEQLNGQEIKSEWTENTNDTVYNTY